MLDFPKITDYKIIRKLDEGRMATVYLGFYEKFKREVAVKILDPSLLSNQTIVERFKREANAVTHLIHSNIVLIYDYGKSGKYHYIIMERLEESLRDRLNRDPMGKISPKNAIEIAKKVMNALEYAHLKGVVHRDIKPENIMFRSDNTPVLVDFGFAHIFDPSMSLTKSGTIMGTIYYMSPEQCKGKKNIDGRSDIYSLGAVLFEMFTGKKPYEGNSNISVALQQIESNVPRLPKEVSSYQPLIDQMMAKDREERLSCSVEFEQTLDIVLKNLSNLNSRPSMDKKKKKKMPTSIKDLINSITQPFKR